MNVIEVSGSKYYPLVNRFTPTQQWCAYNTAQMNEKRLFIRLLKNLIEGIAEPRYEFGRPRTPRRDLLFASAYKVYSQFSLRRFMSDLREAKEKDLIKTKPCFASIGHFMQKEEVTPILQALIRLSALPLQSVETTFAIDSSGFRTTKFTEYCKEKHRTEKHHNWIKMHLCCGTQTNIVTSVEVKEEHSSDSREFIPLVTRTMENGFAINEVSADGAYSSRDNLSYVHKLGGTAFIPFKSNATGKSRGSLTWKKMFHFFQFHREDFMAHYHKRSNVETAFMMIKTKFGDGLKSKTKTAQINEALLKVLCHNIVVLIHEMSELGSISSDLTIEDLRSTNHVQAV